MVDISAITPATTNLTTPCFSTSGVGKDFARFDKGVEPDNDTATMSFDDFLDMINPLQHIPVVSQVYRAVTNEQINPVSRIAGDTLYGAALGPVSAGLAAIGAIGDEMFAAGNEGQGGAKSVVAYLFGDDKKIPTTQLASASAPTDQKTAVQPNTDGQIQLASLATQASQAPIAVPNQLNQKIQSASNTNTSSPSTATTGMPLDRSKLAYGGVMDSSMVQSAQQNQQLALAMAGQTGILQAQHALRNNRFAVSPSLMSGSMPGSMPGVTGSTLPGATPATAPITSQSTAAGLEANPQTQAALHALLKDLQAPKGINQYRSAAQSLPLPGASLDIAN